MKVATFPPTTLKMLLLAKLGATDVTNHEVLTYDKLSLRAHIIVANRATYPTPATPPTPKLGVEGVAGAGCSGCFPTIRAREETKRAMAAISACPVRNNFAWGSVSVQTRDQAHAMFYISPSFEGIITFISHMRIDMAFFQPSLLVLFSLQLILMSLFLKEIIVPPILHCSYSLAYWVFLVSQKPSIPLPYPLELQRCCLPPYQRHLRTPRPPCHALSSDHWQEE